MRRRTFITAAGAGIAGTAAGCLAGSGDEATPGPTASYPGVENGTIVGSSDTTPSGAVPDHPSTAGILDQPRLGNFGKHTIVAFEDPSCSRCKHFEENIVPRIRANLVADGSTTLVARTYPVVYPWGEPATHALEATYAREEPAFWSLFGHYFDQQGEFSTDNVFEKTESYLNAETGVDGSAVVADAESKAYASAVQTDLDAGMNAGAGSTTPTLYLFRDGEYVTSVAGTPSYDTIASTLGEA